MSIVVRKRKKGRRVTLKDTWPLHLMVLPCIILMLVFNTYPLLSGIQISLMNFKPALGFARSKFVGLDNFEYIFQLPNTWQLFRNTLVMAVGKIILTQFLALLYAVLLNEVQSVRLKRSSQPIVYLPHFLSWVILGITFKSMLSNDGTVNQILMNLGLIKEPIWFLGSNQLFQPTMIILEAWKEFGFAAVIFIASLAGINPELHEAAAIDGAGRVKRIWHVTLPGISTTVMLVMALQISGILNAGFDQIYNMYAPVVYESGDIINTYAYRIGFTGTPQYSISTAIGFTKSIICFILTLVSNWLASKYGNRRLF